MTFVKSNLDMFICSYIVPIKKKFKKSHYLGKHIGT
jgi:hypothetical protein